MAFTRKRIDLTFVLGGEATFDGSSNQVTITGLRVSCKIVKTASAAMNKCQLRVWGLPPNIYNALVSIYPIISVQQRNTVTVSAGDTDPLAQVFIGQITLAQVDLNQQPDCVVNIIAQTALLQALTTSDPTSYSAPFSVVSAMQTLASNMSLQFEANDVPTTMMLPKMTLNGNFRDQAIKLAESTYPKLNIGFDDNVLVIFTSAGSRTNQKTTIISDSADPAMIGYPALGNNGIVVKSTYNPNIMWGAQVMVKSSLQVANLNGLWTAYNIAHTLESELPDGKWETEVTAQNFNLLGQE